jgi:hypothetical protein
VGFINAAGKARKIGRGRVGREKRLRGQAENNQTERQQAFSEKVKKAKMRHEKRIFSGIERIFFEIMTGVQQDSCYFRKNDRFFLYDGLWRVWEYRGLVKKSGRTPISYEKKNTFLSGFNCFNKSFEIESIRKQGNL